MEEGDTSSSSSIPNPEGDTVVEGSSHGTGTSAKANSSSDGSGSGSASMNTDKSPQDDIEAQLGITEYLSNRNSSSSSSSDHDALADQQQLGFTGVVKARYSDFIVHEVSIDGKVARLTDTSLPKEEPKQDLRQEDNQAAQEVAGTPSNEADMTDPPTGSTKASSERSKQETLSQLIKNETIAANVFTMLQSHTDTSKEISTGSVEKFVTLPALEKSERKAVHEWVRSALPNEARADTLDGKIRIWHIKYEKEMPNYETFSNNRSSNNNRGSGNRGRNNNDDRQNHKRIKKEWPPDRPDFLRFVLYKENMDTTTATKEVNRRGSTGRIGYAGMKDKRGVTTQFCTLYRTTPDQIVTSTSTNSRFQNNKPSGGGGNTKEKGVSVVQVGNFEYVEKELRLGMLNGNRFDIIIRNIKALDEKEDDNHSSGNDTSEEIRLRRRAVLEAAAQAVKAKGFINYFGTQVRVFLTNRRRRL
jgi:tRNA pseudouridine13 synthase